MIMPQNFFLLKSGISIPSLGVGTDGLSDQEGADLITQALNFGYSLIDTATGYQNHVAVAKAIKTHSRDRVFLCTKFHNGNMEAEQTVDAVCATILKELNIDYIDLLLIHNSKVNNFPEVFKQLLPLKKAGLIKSLGVSNFTVRHLEMMGNLVEHIDVNQIEVHPYLHQESLYQYCKNHKIHIMAYRPLCLGQVLPDPVLQELAKKYHKTVAQIVLNWLITYHHFTAIPKTSALSRLQENQAIFDFSLTEEDSIKIKNLNRNYRTCVGYGADPNEATF